MLVQRECEVVPAHAVRGRALVPADVEQPIALQELTHVRGVDRAGVRDLHHEPVVGHHLREALDLLEDAGEVGLERVVELDRHVAARTEDASELRHDLLERAELVSDVRLGVVDEEVVDDPGVAGEVGDEVRAGRHLVGVGRVGGEEERGRAQLAVAVVGDVADEVEAHAAVAHELALDTEARGRLAGRGVELVDDLLERLGHPDAPEPTVDVAGVTQDPFDVRLVAAFDGSPEVRQRVRHAICRVCRRCHLSPLDRPSARASRAYGRTLWARGELANRG